MGTFPNQHENLSPHRCLTGWTPTGGTCSELTGSSRFSSQPGINHWIRFPGGGGAHGCALLASGSVRIFVSSTCCCQSVSVPSWQKSIGTHLQMTAKAPPPSEYWVIQSNPLTGLLWRKGSAVMYPGKGLLRNSCYPRLNSCVPGGPVLSVLLPASSVLVTVVEGNSSDFLCKSCLICEAQKLRLPAHLRQQNSTASLPSAWCSKVTSNCKSLSPALLLASTV